MTTSFQPRNCKKRPPKNSAGKNELFFSNWAHSRKPTGFLSPNSTTDGTSRCRNKSLQLQVHQLLQLQYPKGYIAVAARCIKCKNCKNSFYHYCSKPLANSVPTSYSVQTFHEEHAPE